MDHISVYATMKAGLNHFARHAALEFAPYGARVNVLSPGAVATPMLAGSDDPERHDTKW